MYNGLQWPKHEFYMITQENSIEIHIDRRIAKKSSPIEPAQDREGGRNSIYVFMGRSSFRPGTHLDIIIEY